MPGFRPGKVPPNLIKKMHGEQLQAKGLNTGCPGKASRKLVDGTEKGFARASCSQKVQARGTGYRAAARDRRRFTGQFSKARAQTLPQGQKRSAGPYRNQRRA